MSFLGKNKVYLDYASGALILKSASLALHSITKKYFANPASIHSFGQEAKSILENSRKIVANSIKSKTSEILFTSSATESIAMAIHGTVMKARDSIDLPHIITSTIEHSAVIENCKLLEKNKLATVTYIRPDEVTGIIHADTIIKSITPDTVIISIHTVNSELGTLQDIASYIKKLNNYKEQKYNIKSMRFVNESFYPYLHTDATQAYVHMDVVPFVLKGIDLISFNSVKIGGPAGVGVLYKRSSAKINPLYAGGSQEIGLRPGTSDVMNIYAFAEAVKNFQPLIPAYEEKYKNLKDILTAGINEINKVGDIEFVFNSSESGIPSIISLSFPCFSGQQMAVELNARGVAVSSKSACHSEESGESYVVSEIRNISENKTYNKYGTIRISFGPETTKKDIFKLLKALSNINTTYKGVLY